MCKCGYVPLFYHSTGSKCEVECVSVGMYLCHSTGSECEVVGYVPLFYHSTGSECEVECVSVGMYLCFIILQGVSVRLSA